MDRLSGKSPRHRIAFLLIGTAFSLAFSAALGVTPEQDGAALATRIYDRPDGRDFAVRARMTLTERGHSPRLRRLLLYRTDRGGGDVRSLVRFLEPGDIADTGLLTLDRPGDESAQWLFLPALNKERRIASSRKGGQFVGSDFYYEDLRDRRVEQDSHRLVGRETYQGISCQVLESIPATADNSAYSKRVAWVHPDILIPLKVDFYEGGREAPTKRLEANRIEKVQGYWTVMESTMTDLRTGHETQIALEAAKYDQGLPADFFALQSLTDPSRDQGYRP